MSHDKERAALERHAKHSKTSVPPDDHHLSQADKTVVADEASATVREGARQSMIERDRVYAAAEDARKEASCEATADQAKATFWQRMKIWFDSL
jgi:hypothetical protein